MIYLVSLLLPFLWYFSQSFHWWTIIFVCQLVIGFLGLWVRNWRILAIVLLTFLSIFYLPWYISPVDLPDTCQKGAVSVSGVVKTSAIKETETLDLMKVRLWCQEKSAEFPLARISFDDTAFKRLKWYGAGDEIELRNVKVSKQGLWGVDITTAKNTRAYDLSFQKKILLKSELFIYLRSRAWYYLDGFSLGVFRALALADRSSLSREWKTRFKDLGVMHIFAISGMHIGIIFVWLTVIIRRSFSFPLKFVHQGRLLFLVDLISLGIILLFIELIGAPISSKRAVIMLFWYILNKHLLYLQPLWFVLLGVAGFILLEQPSAIGQVSFQLSFLSVGAIISILSFLPVKARNDSLAKKIWKTISSIFLISTWILIVTLPVLSTLNQEVSVISPVNNIFHILLMSLILLPLILTTLVISIIGFYTGPSFLEFYCYALVDYALKAWEWVLVLNHHFNQNAVWEPWIEWNPIKIIGYWMLSIGGVSLLGLWKNQKKNTNVHFYVDRFTLFMKNAIVRLRTR